MIVLLRFLLGFVFIFSGYVKGVDPVGLAYKLEEYFTVFGYNNLRYFSEGLSILLCAFELFVGLMLIIGVFDKIISAVTLIITIGFCTLTGYIYFDPWSQITECGCFGEFYSLSNWETFIKNIILVGLALLYFIIVCKKTTKRKNINYKSVIVSSLVLILSFSIPLYSYIFLPPFDFLGFSIGARVLDKDLMSDTDNIIINREKTVIAIIMEGDITNDNLRYLAPVINIEETDDFNTVILSSRDIENVVLAESRENVKFYYADAIVLKSLLRTKNGVVLIDKGLIVGKWKLNNHPFKDKSINIGQIIKNQRLLVYKYFSVITIFIFFLITYLIYNKKELLIL